MNCCRTIFVVRCCCVVVYGDILKPIYTAVHVFFLGSALLVCFGRHDAWPNQVLRLPMHPSPPLLAWGHDHRRARLSVGCSANILLLEARRCVFACHSTTIHTGRGREGGWVCCTCDTYDAPPLGILLFSFFLLACAAFVLAETKNKKNLKHFFSTE